jgi:hypothetical protein
MKYLVKTIFSETPDYNFDIGVCSLKQAYGIAMESCERTAKGMDNVMDMFDITIQTTYTVRSYKTVMHDIDELGGAPMGIITVESEAVQFNQEIQIIIQKIEE